MLKLNPIVPFQILRHCADHDSVHGTLLGHQKEDRITVSYTLPVHPEEVERFQDLKKLQIDLNVVGVYSNEREIALTMLAQCPGPLVALVMNPKVSGHGLEAFRPSPDFDPTKDSAQWIETGTILPAEMEFQGTALTRNFLTRISKKTVLATESIESKDNVY